MSFTLFPHGGLGNRLRALLSYRAVVGPMQVVWLADKQIAFGSFQEVFQPLSDVEFIESIDDVPTSLRTCDQHPRPPLGWTKSYADLRLRPELSDRVAAIQQSLDGGVSANGYSAMHVRRTDHVQLAKKFGAYTPDEAFIEWARKVPQPIFLATDNRATQELMIAATTIEGVPGVMVQNVIPEDNDESHQHRHTRLADAAVDLWVCAGASNFMGTKGSSFSETVAILHGLLE